MTSPNDGTNVPIKYESPYASESLSNFSPQSPTLKRRRSEEPDDIGEKRQRIESSSDTLANDHLAAIIAQATASVRQQLGQSNTGGLISHEQDEQPLSSVSQTIQNGTAGHGNGFTSDPHLYMRILSLPILESLSTQILSTLAQGPYSETIRIITEPESELGQAYATLKSLFDQTKKIYSQQAPFLSADELNIRESEHRATIRTTNLATFVSSVFGGQDVGFYELNDHFIETFTPDGSPLEKDPGELYLNLKTQMYLSAVSQEEQERTKEDILEDLFPVGLDDLLASRHLELPLSQNELDFIEASRNRREYLMNEPSDADSIQALSEKYAWEDFLRNLSAHLSQAYEPLIGPYMKRHALTAPASPIRHSNQNGAYGQQNIRQEASASNSIEDDISAQAERAAQAALQSLGLGRPQQNGSQQMYQPQTQNGSYQSQYTGGNIPFHTQSAPTQVLYEQARQAAVAKANPGNTRRPGLPSQRRPWSTEEENALMAGLDQVKGPHWSQILALYGAKGQVSEILKDRNQVQLKDKARNLKLFFLKSNIEVPYYLQCVTGELKTRAPSQAARKEAEERARLSSNEEQARFNGIMTLANGIQDPSQASERESQPQNAQVSQEQSEDAQNGPEELHVVEPVEEEHTTTPTPPQLNEDEQLRQRLMAATSGAEAPLSSVAPIAF